VRVKVQPRARRDAVLGEATSADGPRLRLAVTAAPEDGRANRAVCALLAEALGVAPSAVQVTMGASAREKTLAVAGDPAALGARLADLVEGAAPQGKKGQA
jgi:uncharacterized protein YggU (UPF0235/DUF167 family)